MRPKRKRFIKGKGCLSEEFKAHIRKMALADPDVVARLSSQEVLEMKKLEKKTKKRKKKCSERKRKNSGNYVTIDFDDDDKAPVKEKKVVTLSFDSDNEDPLESMVDDSADILPSSLSSSRSLVNQGSSGNDNDIMITNNNDALETFDSESDLSVENEDHIVDYHLSYQLELRKQNCLVPADPRFLKVAIPDFDQQKANLKRNKYVVVTRKYFQKNEDVDGNWIYFCSCDKATSTYIESLSFDADLSQDIKECCIHINCLVPIIAEIDYWEEEESIIGYQESFIREDEISDILREKGKILVVYRGSVGIVSNERSQLICYVCSSGVCIHCNEVRRRRDDKDSNNPAFFDEFLESAHSVSSERNRKAISCNRIPFHADENMTRNLHLHPCQYLKTEDSLLVCQDNISCCSEIIGVSSRRLKLFMKNTYFECIVNDSRCTGCGAFQSYDGLNDSILNMGKFLIHYSLMRDYMFHFLHGKSCTLHGYYEVFSLSQKSSGHEKCELTYKDFKDSWYSFLELLDIDFNEGSICKICKQDPAAIICDATSLGHQKKFSALVLQENPSELCTQKFSKHADRLAIADKDLRDSFKEWVTKKNASMEFSKKLEIIYPVIFRTLKWARDTFGDDLPKSIKLFFKCLYSSSPVCSYFGENDLNLSLRMLEPKCKSDAALMKKFQLKLPLLFNILTDCNLETCLPEEHWKGLLLYLSDKTGIPYRYASDVYSGGSFIEENELSSFPNLPPLRPRGSYEQDAINTKYGNCRKNYKGHPNLTSGIFTIYCPHAPDYIVYDNNCSLHSYCLNRDPLFFRWTKFLIDRFHWKNHTACGTGYCMNIYSELEKMNSQINEQQNAATKRLKTQLSYMRPDHFMSHCRFFIWYRNYLKQSAL
ncbi:uncharacterized protein [Clytia hemisphaerica]|uniref:uncharacterized protein isoform X2 n=1 Tax=Clytia hemisphaerica TaxID=252671 RepID=UPI0034D683EB